MTNLVHGLEARYCGRCERDIPLFAWDLTRDDHMVILSGPIAVERGDDNRESNHVTFRATQSIGFGWCADVPRPPTPPDCPECRQGKHPNCAGWALDESTDEFVSCPCAERGHR